MELIADLHFHSKYSRAVSGQMVLPEIARWARVKGIDLITTSDFTHPLWFRELKSGLKEVGEGVYKLNEGQGPFFLLTTEIACIYNQGGKLRRIHNLVFAPGFSEAEKIGTELAKRGNVMSDGRPIFGLSAREMGDLILNLSPEALIIPAHAWTPHFSLYGSESGFDSLEECFGEMAKYIFAVETGLSSSPEMNWRIGELDSRSIISCSDAHSGAKLGREATVFEIEDIKTLPAGRQELRYEDIRKAIIGKWEVGSEKSFDSELRTVELLDEEVRSGKSRNQEIPLHNPSSHFSPYISYTIEFYPEEGKYHFTGHRNCNVKQSPEETKKQGTTCHVCGKKLTIGVMHRVEQLAKSEIGSRKSEIDEYGVRWVSHPQANRPPYAMLVPLLEVLAESMKSTVGSQKVLNEYKKLTDSLGGEFRVLLKTPLSEITKIAGPRVSIAIEKVRKGDIFIEPGFDGVFGTVRIWPFVDAQGKPSEEDKEQMSLF